MSLTISSDLLRATSTDFFRFKRKNAEHLPVDREIELDTHSLDSAALDDLAAAAQAVGDKKAVRAIESIALARSGRFDKPVPNFKAFKGVLEAFLKSGHLDGWIYVTADDGRLYPQLVTRISYDSGGHGRSQGTPSVRIHTIAYGFSRDSTHRTGFGIFHAVHSFGPQSVANRRLTDILADQGLYKETPALREGHQLSLARHQKLTQAAFSRQFRVTGTVLGYEREYHRHKGLSLSARRVIHDLHATDYGPILQQAESFIFEDGAEGLGPVPEHPVVKVFDLRTHEFFWVHADCMTAYEYDKALREKLILPQTHRDLLDVLTTNLEAFVNDFIEGKSAGNVILCKGVPGVGKTLTSEVYAELIERPLYAIHSGSLGTTPREIEQNLQIIFERGKRWDCVLLLDEADVFVTQRGENIVQNAIVAEFLRTLEYFDGLLFMTTNRPNDIDEAIVSRCAAIIDYSPPNARDAAAIWRVMSGQYQAELSEELIDQLVDLFPQIAPRDIKMLFRLALRVATANQEPLTLRTFRRCAMFRAIKMSTDPEAGLHV